MPVAVRCVSLVLAPTRGDARRLQRPCFVQRLPDPTRCPFQNASPPRLPTFRRVIVSIPPIVPSPPPSLLVL